MAVTLLLLVAFGFYARSIFLRPSASLSGPQRLQRQRNFWLVLFPVIVVEALITVMRRQSVISDVTVLVLATIAGIGYIRWSRSFNKT